jgi:hypothetical protein
MPEPGGSSGDMSTRRSYKTEALKWKRAALDQYAAVCQAHYGLTSYGAMTATDRINVVAGVLKKATAQFEQSHPADDEAGWSRNHV